MVVDTLDNARLYTPLGTRIAAALDHVASTNLAAAPAGRYELDGDRVFVLVQDYTSKREGDGRWERHRRYIDLQLVVSGRERIGYAPVSTLVEGPYDPDRDIAFLTGRGSYVTLSAGQFMLLWPNDAHMPGIDAGRPEPVRKLVVKIAVA
jgi:YhcH/YjgK/YiaL family protein